MNTKDFSVYVGASEQVVRRWFRSGRLPGVRRLPDRSWQIDDPQTAAAAWRREADHTKTPPDVLARAVAAGRAEQFAATIPPSRLSREMSLALANGTARYLRWLLETVKTAPGLEEIDLLQLDETFTDYVKAELPSVIRDWELGRITPERDI